MIGVESSGDSFLGEVWFSEAPTPDGPWVNAVKVATHDRGSTGDYSNWAEETTIAGSYLKNSIVILIPQSWEKNLSIYLAFVREVPSQRIYETVD